VCARARAHANPSNNDGARPQLPDAADAEGRRALKRLQEVGVHVLAPAAELAAKPLPGGVAVMRLADALAAGACGV
jgi:(E)-4-hydroxy-3-methylbut-2-enyl-diphosphate synthase